MSAPEVPPLRWAPEAEHSVLGAVLLGADPCDIDLRAADFYDHRHRRLWSLLVGMSAAGEAIDPVTALEAAQAAGIADDIGGLPYLTLLAQAVPNTTRAPAYATAVRDRAVRRAIADAAERACALAWEGDDAAAALDAAAGLFAGIERTRGIDDPVPLADAVMQRTEHWQRLADGDVEPAARTGFAALDDRLAGGLRAGELFVVAARPGVGKSSWSAAVAASFARAGRPALYLSLEMTRGQLVDRLAAAIAVVPLSKLLTGALDESEWGRVAQAGDELAALPLFIDDAAGLKLTDIRAKARAVQRRQGLQLVVIDHLQLIVPADSKLSRHHQIESITRPLKVLAKETGVAVILLSQLNREVEHRAGGAPTLADLRESGATEEDADAVLLLHQGGRQPSGDELIVGTLAKVRNGQRGRIPWLFNGSLQRWRVGEASLLSAPGAAAR